jgi:hypothetical protein
MDRGLMGKGAGHVVYKLAKAKNISVQEAGTLLAQGKCWDEATACLKEGSRMSDMKLKHNEKLDIENILKDLDKSRPKREAGPGGHRSKSFRWDLSSTMMQQLRSKTASAYPPQST